MKSFSNNESAQIIQFPSQRRVTEAAPRVAATPANDSRAPEAFEIMSGSWYHDAAISEERARRR